MKNADKIAGLRARIPSMECLKGCVACCSHVPWSEVEWDLLPADIRSRHTLHSLHCPFVQDGGCSCHEHRPMICRMFGVSEGMECPRGVVPEKTLTGDQCAAIAREYQDFFERSN